jgi:hypothetical protein
MTRAAVFNLDYAYPQGYVKVFYDACKIEKERKH